MAGPKPVGECVVAGKTKTLKELVEGDLALPPQTKDQPLRGSKAEESTFSSEAEADGAHFDLFIEGSPEAEASLIYGSNAQLCTPFKGMNRDIFYLYGRNRTP
ncbi:hypothetical protein HAX54_049760 [Datura stramonium]|uniref:Uncharacterized protein n=1 Tax=Datura stramonium TaxID=4076 RepID=A0ABS8SVC2_DATST|nr:hypothetical protein [Datura stramonium]